MTGDGLKKGLRDRLRAWVGRKAEKKAKKADKKAASAANSASVSEETTTSVTYAPSYSRYYRPRSPHAMTMQTATATGSPQQAPLPASLPPGLCTARGHQHGADDVWSHGSSTTDTFGDDMTDEWSSDAGAGDSMGRLPSARPCAAVGGGDVWFLDS